MILYYLLNHFGYQIPTVEQWIKCDVSSRYETVVTPPLNMSACLCGIVSDSGMAKYAFGFNQNSMTLYSPNSGSTIANLVMIGKI